MSSNLLSIKQRFGIIGISKLLDTSLDTAVRVSATDLTVLITGESGVGKEVFSKIIHSLSPRKHNQFIAINCGAIPEGTINSELFGHEKGAFTGAVNERKGYFETVNGGTIFLDEIGEMPLDTQSYLLRVLETGEFIRVGSSKTETTNVRVIAATNVDLWEKIRAGKFREDLYYRLNTVPITVPSLKERREDIPILFRKFAMDFSDKYRSQPIRLDEKSEIILENYSWPGNIRELKNIAEQLSILSKDPNITAEILVGLVPNIMRRNLPNIQKNNGGANFEEREILYKVLFDMKNDLNDLKSLIFELIQRNNLSVNNVNSLKLLQTGTKEERNFSNQMEHENNNFDYTPNNTNYTYEETDTNRHLLIDSNNIHNRYDKMEVVDENLSLVEMEKDLIQKALKKHNGRRKEPSDDLGISERTLYRKIKEYSLD
jgi:DNA-binding NtrC family response regulator